MIRINLARPAEIPLPAAPPPPGGMVAAVAAIAAILVFGGTGAVLWWTWSKDKADLEKEKAQLQLKKAELDEYQRKIQELQQVENRYKQQDEVVRDLLARRVGPVTQMTALGNAANRMSDLYFLTVTPAAGDRVVISGQASTVESIARFVASLKETGSFEDVQLQRYYQDNRGNLLSFKFNIDCHFLVPTPPAPSTPPQTGAPRGGAARRTGM